MRSSFARPTTSTRRWRSRRPLAACRGSISARPTSPAAPPTSPSQTSARRGASTPPSRRAASGSPTIAAPRGGRSSSTSRARASATSRCRSPIPSILYVGTGEANLFRASMPGVGVFKSSDGGRTFTHAGLADTHTIARILIHPTNPDIVYVAASGHAWTENEMRGVFKTTDGGRTWTKVLYKSPATGAIDLVMDPADPNTLYAATLAAHAAQVERPARRAWRQRERRLEINRRGPHVERTRTAGCRRHRREGESVSTPPPRTPRCSTRSSTTTRPGAPRARASVTRMAGRSWRRASRRQRSIAAMTAARRGGRSARATNT